jgi:hypothetical protein
MDEMVLEPREGIADHRTRADVNPWLDRPRLKLRKAYYKTIGQSIGAPARLARATPRGSRVWTAMGYYAITAVWVSVLTVLPVAVLMAVMIPTGHRGAMTVVWPILAVVVAPLVALLVMPVVWGLLTQILLVFVGGKPTHMGTTYKALAYSSAPMLLCAIPCMGAYAAMIAVPWWMANTIVMLTVMHRIAWWRATIAHVVGGVIVIGVPIGGMAYLASNNPWMRVTNTSFHTQAGRELRSLLLGASGQPGTQQPVHTIDLMHGNGPFAMKADLLTSGTIFPFENQVGGMMLQIHIQNPSTARDPIDAELRAAMLPSGVHRVGHIVMCAHGVDLIAPQGPDLWIAIVWPDPDSGAAFIHPETVVVVLASGVAQDIPLAQFPADLAAQNAMRASLGIPEIPDPATVRMWPPGSAYAPNPQPAPPPAPVP